jgi:hypothetical protein
MIGEIEHSQLESIPKDVFFIHQNVDALPKMRNLALAHMPLLSRSQREYLNFQIRKLSGVHLDAIDLSSDFFFKVDQYFFLICSSALSTAISLVRIAGIFLSSPLQLRIHVVSCISGVTKIS